MLFETNKEKGNAGLALAIAYFGANGYTVSLPLNDTQDYDLVVDDGTNLQKVQVKATGVKTPSGAYECDLRSKGGTKGTLYKRVNETNIDLLFIVTADMTMYLLSKEVFTELKSSITVSASNKYAQYIVKI